jgi:hypothetical protein
MDDAWCPNYYRQDCKCLGERVIEQYSGGRFPVRLRLLADIITFERVCMRAGRLNVEHTCYAPLWLKLDIFVTGVGTADPVQWRFLERDHHYGESRAWESMEKYWPGVIPRAKSRTSFPFAQQNLPMNGEIAGDGFVEGQSYTVRCHACNVELTYAQPGITVPQWRVMLYSP